MNPQTIKPEQAMLVKQTIIDPINTLCSYQQITVEKSVYYVEALARFAKDILSAAMKEIAVTWEKNIPPQPGEIVKICFRKEEETYAKRAHQLLKPVETIDQIKVKIFSTAQGRKALELGVAHSFFVACHNGKKPESFSDGELKAFLAARSVNTQRAERIQEKQNIEPMEQTILNIWSKMQRYEAELQEEMKQLGI